jgi:hypothetical protein
MLILAALAAGVIATAITALVYRVGYNAGAAYVIEHQAVVWRRLKEGELKGGSGVELIGGKVDFRAALAGKRSSGVDPDAR